MKKISIYDFDNTLYSGNSLKDFIEFVIAKENNFILRYKMKMQYFIFLNIYTRLLRRSKTNFLISNLKGYRKEYIENCANLFLKKLKYHSIIYQQLKNDIKNGYQVWIVSGSIEEIISVSATMLGVNYWMAGKLKYVAGTCVGELEFDIRGKKKREVLIAFEGDDINWAQSKFISDNKEDIDCGSMFGEYVAVAHSLIEKNNFLLHTSNILLIEKP